MISNQTLPLLTSMDTAVLFLILSLSFQVLLLSANHSRMHSNKFLRSPKSTLRKRCFLMTASAIYKLVKRWPFTLCGWELLTGPTVWIMP
ncbi:hypothetical protein Gohar_019027 [Gossypium harknessii]|uniref:Uncharacterized protein n=1 Tax=Gossypium harknessii TaxID=34285 RepID=A0A7J9GAZ8_9ROSI|nr:hypothetical protein [Gossypium harknessii]